MDEPIHVGNVSGGKGFAIGPGARSIFVEIRSLLDLSVLLPLVQRHWLLITASIVLQAIVIILWRSYTDRFLISIWVLVAGMGLLEAALVGGYGFVTRPQKRLPFALLTILPTLALIGLTRFEYVRVVYPVKFEADEFGVAVAQFGEGPEFLNTPQAREVSGLVLQRLKQQAKENPDLRFVQFRSIGLIRTKDEAVEEGQRHGADLVIWGQLQVSGAGTALNFVVLETADKVANPTFPRVLPLFETPAEGMLEIPSRNSEEIAAGTTTIAGFTFGLAQYFQWDFASAARAFQEALRSAPQGSITYRYLLHFYYGLSLQWPGHLKRANEQFKLAAALLPDDPAAPLALAFGYRSQGEREAAKARAQHAFDLCTYRIQLGLSDPLTFLDRAIANEILEDWAAALNDYQAALVEDPDLFLGRIGVMRSQIVLNQLENAIHTANETISQTKERGGNPAWAYLYLALAQERNNDIRGAQLSYEQASKLAPGVDWIHFEAGRFYAATNNPVKAEQEYQLMIEVSSNKSWAYTTLADFYVAEDQLEKALATYQAALQTDPHSSRILVSLAETHFSLGQTDDARKAFARAVEEEPDNVYARFLNGNFLYSQGELEAAITQWEEALQMDPSNCDLLFNLGVVYSLLGDNEQARTYYTQAVQTGGNADAECLVKVQTRLDELNP